MKIQGVDTVELLNSKLMNFLPGLDCLAGMQRPKSMEQFSETARALRGCKTEIFTLGAITFGATFARVLAQREVAVILSTSLIAGFAFVTAMACIGTYCYYRSLKIFTASVNNILQITEHYRTVNPNSIMQFAKPDMVKDAIRTTLIVIAKNVLQATPDSDRNRGAFRDFKKLHKSAEAIGFKLGPYELFFDPARELILQEQTAKAAGEAAATPPSALS